MEPLETAVLRDLEEPSESTIRAVSEALKTPAGTQVLRPIQVQCLLELAQYRRLYCGAKVGAGKTLIAALAPTVMQARRPLLLVPANLRSKTIRDLAKARQHWRISRQIQVVSYQKLSNRANPTLLEELDPDLVICDESHKVKNVLGAACARRLNRFRKARPSLPIICLTATGFRTSLLDVGPHLCWSLRDYAPVPDSIDALTEWAAAVDEYGSSATLGSYGPNFSVFRPWLGPVASREEARQAFARRVLRTPGVVLLSKEFDEVALTIQPLLLKPAKDSEQVWSDLRRLWMMPDGWLLADRRMAVAAAAKDLALGFYSQIWPRPPEDWSAARREWCSFCRRVIEDSETYDTEAQVREACERGDLPDEAWRDWDAIRRLFEPKSRPIWLSDHALLAVRRWGAQGGIVWTSRIPFAERLSELTGWPYYGKKGCDAKGRHVQDTTAETIICSTQSNTEGRNLQIGIGPGGRGYHRNLFVTPPVTALDWEQRIGRTHRPEQHYDVTVDYLVGCIENFVAPTRALAHAKATKELFAQPSKLETGALVLPPTEWLEGPAFGVTQ